MSSDLDILIAAIGVGYLESAIQLAGLFTDYPAIRNLIFTGSAGVYPSIKSIQVGDLCSCQHTLLVDGAAELGFSQYAKPLHKKKISATLSLDNALYPAKIATLLSLTKTDSLVETVCNNLNVELETMELYGVARVCFQHSIAWNAVLGITNTVGTQGHFQWKQNYQQVSEKTGEFLHEAIKTEFYR